MSLVPEEDLSRILRSSLHEPVEHKVNIVEKRST